MDFLTPKNRISSKIIAQAAKKFGTPLYIYDSDWIINECNEFISMPNAFGINVRYAMKANSLLAILQLIDKQGLYFDASSLNEARVCQHAGINIKKIMLTSQELPEKKDREDLENMMLNGLRYNACSLRQLELIAGFLQSHNLPVSIRLHPGDGDGESLSRDTGGKHACFGIALSDINKVVKIIDSYNLIVDGIHSHIGSGSNPKKWVENIERMLKCIDEYFPGCKILNLGGGFKEARMPNEERADVFELGNYAKKKFEEFYKKTGRKLALEIEPGTRIIANAGYIITEVVDLKSTGESGYEFIVVNGGMNLNSRIGLYGATHPFFIVDKEGKLKSSDYSKEKNNSKIIPVGVSCESGDCWSLDKNHMPISRTMCLPKIGDYFVVGGSGAYCSSMALKGYNSQIIPNEVIYLNEKLHLIKRKQDVNMLIEGQALINDINNLNNCSFT